MIAVSKRMAIAAAFVTAASFPAWANNDQQNAENLRERQSRFDELKKGIRKTWWMRPLRQTSIIRLSNG